MRRTSWIDQRINDGVAMRWLLPWFGGWFFLAAADWRDGGSPPSWRRRASPWKRGDASHARICSRCDRARTRSWRSQNCPHGLLLLCFARQLVTPMQTLLIIRRLRSLRGCIGSKLWPGARPHIASGHLMLAALALFPQSSWHLRGVLTASPNTGAH